MQPTIPRASGADPGYGFTAHLKGVAPAEARQRITQALADEGFGILTEIDVQAVLRKKLDLGFRPYVILGACNPDLASRALAAELGVGLLLPCNVCVWAEPEGSAISIASPRLLGQVAENSALHPIMDEAEQRLRRALERARRSGAPTEAS
jgi:uncharacterized protein (DUF302 family)